ncbi:hypothetical protein ABK040_004024 [Willaertia magna]
MRVSLLYLKEILNPLLLHQNIIYLILSFLDIRSLCILEMSSKYSFQNVINDLNFWILLSHKYNINDETNLYEENIKQSEKLLFIKNLKQKIVEHYLKDLNNENKINTTHIADILLRNGRYFDYVFNNDDLKVNFLIEISKSSRAGCKLCGEQIIQAIRGVVKCDFIYPQYFHLTCFIKLLKKSNVNLIEQVNIDINNIEIKEKVNNYLKEYFTENKSEILRKEGNLKSKNPFVYCCDNCNKLILFKPIMKIDNLKERNYYCETCYESLFKSKGIIDDLYCNLNYNIKFTCNKCEKPIKDCVFHCNVCENYNLCFECHNDLKKLEKQQHEHNLFSIGNVSSNEINNQIINIDEQKTSDFSLNNLSSNQTSNYLSNMKIKIKGIKKQQEVLHVLFVEINNEDVILNETIDEIRKSHPQELIDYFINRIIINKVNTEKRKGYSDESENNTLKKRK